MRHLLTLTFLCAALSSGCANLDGYGTAPAAPAKTVNGMLTNAAGMTLYVFDKDPADASKSVCNGPCAALWPALLVDDGAKASGDWQMVTRDDGKKQWAFKGKPLYIWSRDQKPGDTTGDGFNSVWHIARP